MPHAVRKRTPRVPVSYLDKDNSKRKTPPSKQNLKHNMDVIGDDVAHEIAMALTEASQKGGSPQVSRMSNRKLEGAMPTLYRNGERMVIFSFIVYFCCFCLNNISSPN